MTDIAEFADIMRAHRDQTLDRDWLILWRLTEAIEAPGRLGYDPYPDPALVAQLQAEQDRQQALLLSVARRSGVAVGTLWFEVSVGVRTVICEEAPPDWRQLRAEQDALQEADRLDQIEHEEEQRALAQFAAEMTWHEVARILFDYQERGDESFWAWDDLTLPAAERAAQEHGWRRRDLLWWAEFGDDAASDVVDPGHGVGDGCDECPF